MNTSEIVIKNPIKNWKDFINRMNDQFLKYEKIEGIENWESFDFSIDCCEDQMKFKDMLQIRFIEELTEANEAIEENNFDHFKEELADSINFFISGILMYSGKEKLISNPPDFDLFYKGQMLTLPSLEQWGCYSWKLVNQTGKVCNYLKNRPWSQSNFLVSLYDFEKELKKLWKLFWSIMVLVYNLDEKTLYDIIERKIEVNQNRIQTGY